MPIAKGQLLSQVAATGAGDTFAFPPTEQSPFTRTFQAGLVGGTSATVIFDVSNDAKHWAELGSVTVDAGYSGGFSSQAPWRYARARVSTVSGYSPAIDATVGYYTS